MRTQLLATFSYMKKLEKTIRAITENYDVVGNIFVLQNTEEKNQLACTYNIELMQEHGSFSVVNTISLHRKKHTNTLYTINAVNEIVRLLNDGDIDPTFELDWEKYKNCILVTNENGLRKIPTQIYKII